MKRKSILLTIILLIFIYSSPLLLKAQKWGGNEHGSRFIKNWSINANVGYTSYFGDMSYYDNDVVEKLSSESGAAYGIMLTKDVTKWLGLSGQLFYGKLKGGNNNITFKTDLIEYNLQARIDFINLFWPDNRSNFGIIGSAGIGQLLFNVTTFEFNEGPPIIKEHTAAVPEFVYSFGAGIYYKVTERIGITADLNLHQLQNDKLDNLVKNNDFDYYTYLSIGITYYLSGAFKRAQTSTARIAHSGIRTQ